MRSKKKLAVAAVIVAVMVTMIIPSAYGVQPDNAGTLYSTYLDWLQGKPVGLAKISLGMDHQIQRATLVVVDYTLGEPKILYQGPMLTPTVKIQRIPKGTKIETVIKDGKVVREPRTVYRPVKLLIIVSGENYWGTKFIEFHPEKPLTSVNIKVPLHRDNIGPSIQNLNPKNEFQATSVKVGDMFMEDVKIFRLYSVPGVEEHLIINEDDTLAIDSFSQTVAQWEQPSSDRWERSGRVSTPFGYASEVPTSDGKMKTVYATVRYRIDRYDVCGYLICRTVYELIPQEIVYFSKIDTDNDPGTIPSNLIRYSHLRDAGDEFTAYFQESSDDGGVYFSTSVSACAGEGVQICFSGTVDTYRQSSNNRPAVKVIINSWHGNVLYFAKYSENGNYYEVPLQWG